MEDRDTKSAFLWIVGILQNHKIPFQIEGGFAARLYGSLRELADIDIGIPEDKFDELLPEVREYITFGPTQHVNEVWDIKLMTLQYKGQDIDLFGAYKQKFFDKKKHEWVSVSSDFSLAQMMDAYGIQVPVISKEKLIAYKESISREVDKVDIENLKN
jgi:hypothetical protein